MKLLKRFCYLKIYIKTQKNYFIILQYPNEISLINVGPLTNTALAIRMFPEFRDNLKELYIMGGNYLGLSVCKCKKKLIFNFFTIFHLGKGNTTNSAEFNFYSDPEAAYIVLDNPKFNIYILPWETCIYPNLDVTWVKHENNF